MKKKTKSSGESNSKEVTTIESLPDDVRCHILSFLPTKKAAATSLLSKRWKPLWLSLRSFDFHDKDFCDFHKFSDFVTSFFSLPHSVHSLRFTCGYHVAFPINLDDFDLFLQRVALKGVRELDLQMTFSTIFPNGFYSCNTLVTLKLENVILDYSSYVDFPLLKSLCLNGVIVGSHAIMFKFLCGCPNLEYYDATWIRRIGDDILPLVEEGAKSLPKLVGARIGNPFFVFSDERFSQILMNFNDCVYNPMFHNLIHLDLTFKFGRCNELWNWFAQVRHKLQNLTIYRDFKCVNGNGNEHWKDPQIDSECLSTQLRTFTFKNYKGLNCEAQFAKYIMKNSKVLQNMTIHTTLNIDLDHPMLETLSL